MSRGCALQVQYGEAEPSSPASLTLQPKQHDGKERKCLNPASYRERAPLLSLFESPLLGPDHLH